MPPISYLEEPFRQNEKRAYKGGAVNLTSHNQQSPEPPLNYEPKQPAGSGPDGPDYHNDDVLNLAAAQRRILIAQILAVVSLLIGGVLLSTVALVFALSAHRKVVDSLSGDPNDVARIALRRSARIAIVLSVVALILNAVSLLILYPMVMEMLQSGEYASLFGSAQSTPTPNAGNSTWG